VLNLKAGSGHLGEPLSITNPDPRGGEHRSHDKTQRAVDGHVERGWLAPHAVSQPSQPSSRWAGGK